MNEFKRAEGQRYNRFLARLHQTCLFDWYLEVGCRKGRTFALARGKTLAVDPFFQVDTNVIGPKPALHLFQQTSDDFFDSQFLEKLDIRLSFSFLDGMHLFEYLLRDMINTEKASDPKAVIALHDCCPYSHKMTTRDLDNIPGGAWTGDVWKLIPILREYRPDLHLTVLDSKPTGLVLLSNLDPASNVLSENYDQIVQEYQDQTLESFGLARFNELFEYTDTKAFARDGYRIFRGVSLSENQRFKPKKVTP